MGIWVSNSVQNKWVGCDVIHGFNYLITKNWWLQIVWYEDLSSPTALKQKKNN